MPINIDKIPRKEDIKHYKKPPSEEEMARQLARGFEHYLLTRVHTRKMEETKSSDWCMIYR